ncbi:MAG: rRNA adenine N-6-methyltransferase family protein [Candidatus Pacearchaeota archaeon]
MQILLFFAFIFYIFLLWLFYTRFFGAEYYPTSKKVIKKMIEFAELKKEDIVYDLGCGDGRILLAVARKCKRAIGIEVDLLRFLWSKLKTKGKNICVIRKNFFNQNISDANVIFIFLRQETNNKLLEKFKKELKPGSRIVSHYWRLNLNPWKVDKKLKVYAYRI